jgi:O-antigen ligase
MSAAGQPGGAVTGAGTPRATPARRRWVPRAAAALGAVTTAAVVVVLGTLLGPGRQVAVVAAMALGLPATLLFIARPRAVLKVYLFALPLAAGGALVAGFNAGELLTLGMVGLGAVTLWSHGDRLPEALGALAPILWPLVGLAGVSLASMLVNEIYSIEGVAAALFKTLAFGLVAVLVYVYADTLAGARSLLVAVLLGGVAVAVYSIVAYLLGWSYSATYDYNRAMGTFSTWNHLGGFMALVSVPTMALASTTRRFGSRPLWLLAFLAQLVALLLSLTLGSIVAIAVAGVLAGVLIFRMDWRRLVGPALVGLAGFAVVLATNPLLREKLARIDERVVDRLRTYEVGLSMFRDQFWFGFGSPERVEWVLHMTNRYGLTSFGNTRVVPHNSLLLMGVEKGVFGLVFFALLVGGSVWLLLRCRRAFEGTRLSLLYQGLLVGALAFLVQSMTNNLIVHARLGILYFSLVAITVRLASHAEAEARGGDRAMERAEPVPAGPP